MNTLLQVGLSNVIMATGLALLAAAIGHCCRRPALAHGLWLLVLLKLITPPLVPIPVLWLEDSRPPEAAIARAPEAIEPPAWDPPIEERAHPPDVPGDEVQDLPEPALEAVTPPAPVVEVQAEEPPPTPAEFSWPLVAAGLWLTGSLVWFGLAGRRLYRFGRLLRHAQPAPPELVVEAEQLAARLGLPRCPRLWLMPGIVSPMLWAVGRAPRLLFPAQLLERLTAEQRASLFAHELAHLRRRDHWVRVLEFLVLGLYWWCPLVWWACAELRKAEEECCDAWVVWALPGGARAYALALVETVDFLAAVPPDLPHLASGIGHVRLLKRRLIMILGGKTPRALTVWGLLVLGGLGVLLLPLLPTWAQTPGIQKDVEKELDRIRHMREELEKTRQQLQKQQAQLEKQEQELRKAAASRLGEVGKPVPPRPPQPPQPPNPPTPGQGPRPPFGKGPPPFAKGPEMAGRLHELERKVESLLKEIQDLRRDMTSGRPGFGPPPFGEKPFPGRKKSEEGRDREPTPRTPDTPDTPRTPAAKDRPGFFPPPIQREAPEAGARPPGAPAGGGPGSDRRDD